MKATVGGLLGLMVSVTVLSSFEVHAAEYGNFHAGRIRGTLRWDGTDSEHADRLRFGGSIGMFVLDGIELGYEQLFEVESDEASSFSRLYLRYVPFEWPLSPFVLLRTGMAHVSGSNNIDLGAGVGFVFFVDKNFGFEATLSMNTGWLSGGRIPTSSEFDWRLAAYF